MKSTNRHEHFIISVATAAVATAVTAVTATLWIRTKHARTNSNFLKFFSSSSSSLFSSCSSTAHAHHEEEEEEDSPKRNNNRKKLILARNVCTIQIQWPTLVALYLLLHVKPRHASFVLLPLLYLQSCSDAQQQQQQKKKKKKQNQDTADDNDYHDGSNYNHQENRHDDSIRKDTVAAMTLRQRSTSVESQQSVCVECSSDEAAFVSSVSSVGGGGGGDSSRQQRFVDILVHNVSHTDLVLCLGIPHDLPLKSSLEDLHQSNKQQTRDDGDPIIVNIDKGQDLSTSSTRENKDTEYVDTENDNKREDAVGQGKKDKILLMQPEEAHALCRPRFSAFDMFCQRILRVLETCSRSSGIGSGSGDGGCDDDGGSSSLQDDEKQQQQTQQQQQQRQCLYSSIMSFPRYERSDSCARFSLVTPRPSRRTMLPVGFNLSQLVQDCSCSDLDVGDVDRLKRETLELDSDDLMSLRVRGRDMAKMEAIGAGGYWPLTLSPKRIRNAHDYSDSENVDVIGVEKHDANTGWGLHLEAVFFPLLSSLLRRWHNQMIDKYGPLKMNTGNVKKVLILVSGVGTPRNWTHSKTGNSTEACAKLMEIFIKVLYPDVVVVRLHSEREIFRYDENIAFANKELLPCIDAYRDAHARGEAYPDEVGQGLCGKGPSSKAFDTDWKQTFALTLSFADGAPARTHAIQSSLRPYRPTYFHFWQLKTFWHDSKICDDDIEVHSFESMETVPPMEVRKTNADVQIVVEEMKRFRQDFLRTFLKGNNDIQSFWLRKTKKPVLAVLLVNLPGKGLTMYRGTNMEVSMPTGSLCAERNVIGTALATNPGLRREDLMMVAVLAIPLPKERLSPETPQQIPSPPLVTTSSTCTNNPPNDQSAKESAFFFTEVERKLSKYQRPENRRRSMSIGSFASIVEDGESNDTDDSSWENMSSNDPNLVQASPVRVVKPSRKLSASDSACAPLFLDSEAGTPIRKIKLYGDAELQESVKDESQTGKYRRKKSRTVLVHSSDVSTARYALLLFSFYAFVLITFISISSGHQPLETMWSL